MKHNFLFSPCALAVLALLASLTSSHADYEDYSDQNVSGQNFSKRSLNWSSWVGATAVGTNFTGANLSYARFWETNLQNAKFTNAIIDGAGFWFTTGGLTLAQLYSTKSYKNKYLGSITISGDLSGGNFVKQDMSGADLTFATLTGANFTDALLEDVAFGEDIANAKFTNAFVAGAHFGGATERGFTKEQLYSTRSYKDKNLARMGLIYNDMTGWNFSGQNMQSAWMSNAKLTNANFTNTNLQGAGLRETELTGADFTSAIITDANFRKSNLTQAQLYSTQSYKGKKLGRISLEGNSLNSWDFSDQDMRGANLHDTTLTGANFTNAIVTDAYFGLSGLTKEQLTSTKSYKDKELGSIHLGWLDLTGLDFSGQDLQEAFLFSAKLTGADFTDAIITDAFFGSSGYSSLDLTKEQLASTKSYKDKELGRIVLYGLDLSGCDFSGQDLREADLSHTTLAGADFTDAIIAGTSFAHSDLTKEQLYSTKSYKDKELGGISLNGIDLRGWNFSGQNCSEVYFGESALDGTDFTNADLRGAAYSLDTFNMSITKNTMVWDGTVVTNGVSGTSLSSADDYLHVRWSDYTWAKIATDSTVSGGAKIFFDMDSTLKVVSDTTLSMSGADTSLVFDITKNGHHGVLDVVGTFSFDEHITLSLVLSDNSIFKHGAWKILTLVNASNGTLSGDIDNLLENQITLTYQNGSVYEGVWRAFQNEDGSICVEFGIEPEAPFEVYETKIAARTSTIKEMNVRVNIGGTVTNKSIHYRAPISKTYTLVWARAGERFEDGSYDGVVQGYIWANDKQLAEWFCSETMVTQTRIGNKGQSFPVVSQIRIGDFEEDEDVYRPPTLDFTGLATWRHADKRITSVTGTVIGSAFYPASCAQCDEAEQGDFVELQLKLTENMVVGDIYYPDYCLDGNSVAEAHFHGTYTTRYNASMAKKRGSWEYMQWLLWDRVPSRQRPPAY